MYIKIQLTHVYLTKANTVLETVVTKSDIFQGNIFTDRHYEVKYDNRDREEKVGAPNQALYVSHKSV